MIDYEAVLLRLYQDPGLMRTLLDAGLRRENLFFSEEAQKVFDLAKRWFRETGNTVPEQVLLEHHKQYIETIREQGSDDETDYSPKWIVERLKSRYLFSEFRRHAEEASKAKAFDANLSYEEALENAKVFTHELMEITVNSTDEEILEPMSEKLPQFVEDTLSFDKVAEGVLSFGVARGAGPERDFPIDDTYGGLRKGETVSIGAYLKVGKTRMLASIALENARLGHKVVLWALEPSEEDVFSILAAIAAELPMKHVDDKTLFGNERDRFRSLIGDETFERLYVKHPRNAGSRTIEELYWQSRDVEADLVVIDQWSHIHFEVGRNDSDWLIEEKKAYALTELTKEIGVASVVAQQLNRGAEKKKTPSSGNVARSVGLQRAATFNFYLAPVPGQKEMRTLSCREPRRGPVTSWALKYGWDPMVIQAVREVIEDDE